MRKLTFSLAAIAALCLVPFGHCIVQAQEDAKPVNKQATTTHLFDMIPTKLDGRKPSENRLTNGWRPDKCILNGVEYEHSISFGELYDGGTATFYVKGYDYFDATIGVQKQSDRQYSVRYIVLGDEDKRLQTTPLQTQDSSSTHLHVSIKGVTELTLKIVTDNIPPRFVWWGDARLVKGNPSASAPAGKKQEGTEGNSSSDTSSSDEPTSSGPTFTFEIRDIEDLAKKLKEQVEEDKDQFKTKPVLVAIASFDLIPKSLSPDNARKVREQLSTALIKTKTFRVVERAQIDKIVDELKRSKSDLSDSATALKIGKQTSARAVLVGSISDDKTYITVNVRMINTETGESTIAESVEVKKR